MEPIKPTDFTIEELSPGIARLDIKDGCIMMSGLEKMLKDEFPPELYVSVEVRRGDDYIYTYIPNGQIFSIVHKDKNSLTIGVEYDRIITEHDKRKE